MIPTHVSLPLADIEAALMWDAIMLIRRLQEELFAWRPHV